jgi:hypothetical protein
MNWSPCFRYAVTGRSLPEIHKDGSGVLSASRREAGSSSHRRNLVASPKKTAHMVNVRTDRRGQAVPLRRGRKIAARGMAHQGIQKSLFSRGCQRIRKSFMSRRNG